MMLVFMFIMQSIANALVPMRVGKCRAAAAPVRAQPFLPTGKRPLATRSLRVSQMTVCARKGATKAGLKDYKARFSSAPTGAVSGVTRSPGCAPFGRLPGVKHGCALMGAAATRAMVSPATEQSTVHSPLSTENNTATRRLFYGIGE